MREFLSIGLMVLFGCILIFMGSLGIANTMAGSSCSATATAMKVEYNYGFWTGCLISVNGRYIPIENYITMKGAK